MISPPEVRSSASPCRSATRIEPPEVRSSTSPVAPSSSIEPPLVRAFTAPRTASISIAAAGRAQVERVLARHPHAARAAPSPGSHEDRDPSSFAFAPSLVSSNVQLAGQSGALASTSTRAASCVSITRTPLERSTSSWPPDLHVDRAAVVLRARAVRRAPSRSARDQRVPLRVSRRPPHRAVHAQAAVRGVDAERLAAAVHETDDLAGLARAVGRDAVAELAPRPAPAWASTRARALAGRLTSTEPRWVSSSPAGSATKLA